MDDQLEKVRRAYDLTVEQFRQGVYPYEHVPAEIRNTDFFKSTGNNSRMNSSAPDIREFLCPETGKKFLDAGCSANLVNYGLGSWPSLYFGVDISPKLIKAMKGFAELNRITIGGLYVSEISALPFEAGYFDIAAVIGVLEYCTPDYISQALGELRRVLKPGGRIVLDIPNATHPHAGDMQKLEAYLGRPVFPHSRDDFEEMLKNLFEIKRTDDSGIMLRYFARSR